MSDRPRAVQGVGQKSAATKAKDLQRLGWSWQEIADALGVEPTEARELVHGKPKDRRRSISEASLVQRAKVKGKACVRCRRPGPCDPAHLIDRSLAADTDGDPRRVVALCRRCHDLYDGNLPGEERISLAEHLEPYFREEVAFAVEEVGLIKAMLRITGNGWTPVVDGEVAELAEHRRKRLGAIEGGQ